MAKHRFLCVLAILASSGTAVAQDDLVAEGETVFIHCRGCHLIGDRKPVFTLAAPHLNDLFGRQPGSLPDRWRYSDQMVAFGQDKIWDEATLTTFLHDPQGLVKGTKMDFSGLKNDHEIKAVLAYLATFDPDGMAPD
jgi:cytochrome c